jgi:hypothetical protein
VFGRVVEESLKLLEVDVDVQVELGPPSTCKCLPIYTLHMNTVHTMRLAFLPGDPIGNYDTNTSGKDL